MPVRSQWIQKRSHTGPVPLQAMDCFIRMCLEAFPSPSGGRSQCLKHIRAAETGSAQTGLASGRTPVCACTYVYIHTRYIAAPNIFRGRRPPGFGRACLNRRRIEDISSIRQGFGPTADSQPHLSGPCFGAQNASSRDNHVFVLGKWERCKRGASTTVIPSFFGRARESMGGAVRTRTFLASKKHLWRNARARY